MRADTVCRFREDDAGRSPPFIDRIHTTAMLWKRSETGEMIYPSRRIRSIGEWKTLIQF